MRAIRGDGRGRVADAIPMWYDQPHQRRELGGPHRNGVKIMVKLSAKQEKFFSFLAQCAEGDVISKTDIVNASGWSESTVNTYFTKKRMDPFLRNAGTGRYIVLRSGRTISRAEIKSAFTQTRSEDSPPTQSDVLQGKYSRYTLDKKIGRGAVAQVWSAKSMNDEQRAVKIMDPREFLLDPSRLENVRQRFVLEFQKGMRLEHDHVVRYRDVGETKSRPFLVMDHAEHSLESRLTTDVMDLRESLHVVKCCLSGLEYIHGANCVHRDVKPGNILKIGNQWVLGDLGIVRWSDMSAITRSSMPLGSWKYMAPEQYQDSHDVDSRSDVYALGITWYEMLTRKVPSPGAVGAQDFEPPTKIDVVDGLIAQMISYSAEGRPTVADMIRRVRDFEESRFD